MFNQRRAGIWARASAPESALHWLIALLLFCQGFAITINIMGVAMMTDPRLQGFDFWGKVLEKAFAGGRAAWMTVGLLSLAYASAIVLGLFLCKGQLKSRSLYIGWAILASAAVLVLSEVVRR